MPAALLDWYDKRKASIAAANMPEFNATAKAHWDWRDDMVREEFSPRSKPGAKPEDILQGMSSWGFCRDSRLDEGLSQRLYTLSDLTARQLSSAERKPMSPRSMVRPSLVLSQLRRRLPGRLPQHLNGMQTESRSLLVHTCRYLTGVSRPRAASKTSDLSKVHVRAHGRRTVAVPFQGASYSPW